MAIAIEQRIENTYADASLAKYPELTGAWEDKRRHSTTLPHEAYIYLSLEKPTDFNVENIIDQTLAQMSHDPELAAKWAHTWGGVVIGFHPGIQGSSLRLLHQTNPDKYPYVPMSTNRTGFEAGIQPTQRGLGIHEININTSHPMGMEAVAISLIHLIDWLVWEKYLRICEKQPSLDQTAAYTIAVQHIKQEGFRLIPQHQEVITQQYLNPESNSGDYSLRLYGSGGCKTVPFLMGGTRLNSSYPCSEPLSFQLSGVSSVIQAPEITVMSEVPFDHPTHPGIYFGVTLAKRLHLGHLLTAIQSDLLARQINGHTFLISNNTAPRVAEAILSLVDIEQLEPESILSKLVSGQITPHIFEQAYQHRNGKQYNQSLLRQVRELLTRSNYMIGMENFALATLYKAGLMDIHIESEQLHSERWKQLTTQIDPHWTPFGFAFARLGNRGLGGTPLMNEGEYSLSTKWVSSIVDIHERQQFNGSLLVANDPESSYVAQIMRKHFLIPTEQTAGFGVGFGHEITSGTSGKVPTADKLLEIDRIAKLSPDELRKGLIFFISTGFLATKRLAGKQTNHFFPFPDTENSIQTLVTSVQKATALNIKVANAYEILIKRGDSSNSETEQPPIPVLKLKAKSAKLTPRAIVQEANNYQAIQSFNPSQELNPYPYEIDSYLSDLASSGLHLLRRRNPWFEILIQALDIDPMQITPSTALTLGTILNEAWYKSGLK